MSEQIDLLIGRSDITPYAQIAIQSRDENMLFPHVIASQNVDVQPALGGALFTDLLTNRTDEKYRTLLEGGTYQNTNGNTVRFQGLKAAIACFTYARYLMWKNAVDTPFGVVSKKSEYSELADTKLITSIASEKRSEAMHYLRESIEFIKENENEYPLFWESCNRQQPDKGIHKLNGASRI
jgi:hypothetical protein